MKTESNRIEYKQELTNGLEKEVIAFLNYREGGVIYIGIDKNGSTIGLEDSDAVQLKIKDRLKNNIQPSCMGLFDVVNEDKDGKDIIKIIVASGSEKPYYLAKFGMTKKGCYIRLGSASEPMPERMIDDLYSKRTRNSLGKIVPTRQDLTFEQLKIYYYERGLTLTDKFANNLELLSEDKKYNYVAYLMADENGNSIKVAKYSSLDRVDLIETNEYGYCSLIKATKSVLNKLELENRTATKITSKERINTRLWDEIAIREAIINAIIHNDYTREIPPKFEIFPDRFEITSHGGLFEGMSENDFFEGLSQPRNKELMRIFNDLGMVEQLGSGVPRILKSYDKTCFTISDNYLRMTFPSSVPVYEDTRKDNLEKTTSKITSIFNAIVYEINKSGFDDTQIIRENFGVFSEYLTYSFGVNSDEIQESFGEKALLTLFLLMIDNSLSAKSISEKIGVSARTIENYLSKFRKHNIIERIGSDKAGTWRIINNVK